MRLILALLLAFTLVAGAHAARSTVPPHHALWLCVHDNEAATDWHERRNRGHRGGLQLHLGWGYGSSYDAADDSQLEQEWAAELAYRASGFSRDWLIGQWFVWDHAYYCLRYAG